MTWRSTPITDKDACWAIGVIREYLPRAVRDGSDVEAREMMAYAQYAAGMAFSNAGLGMVHAMAHALGGFYNLPHGVCNAVLLPFVLERIYQAFGSSREQLLTDLPDGFFLSLDVAHAAHPNVPEKADIVKAARRWELPVWSNPCPSAGKTNRANFQEKIAQLHGGDKMLRTNLFNGLCRWQLAQSEKRNA